jgi:uncharacterized protein involved in copper resistance
MKCVKSLLLAAGLLGLAGCASNVTIPSPGLDHPANPQAAAAPLSPPPTIPTSSVFLKEDSLTRGMNGMREMQNMKSMEEMNPSSMQGMDHEYMEGMHHEMHQMDHSSMDRSKHTDHPGMNMRDPMDGRRVDQFQKGELRHEQ